MPSTTPRRDFVLEAIGIHKRYRRRPVLDGVSLRAAAGEAVAVVGENGSGKTTLMRICAGTLTPDDGIITTAGRVGYCPQQPALLDLLNAAEHLAVFGAALGLSARAGIAAGRQLLAELGFPVGDLTLARDLSGGARQKLNLALALLGDPRLLLLDEPYQGFDHGGYISFWDYVARWRAQGKAVVIITHVLPDETLVDRIVELTVPAPRLDGGDQRS